MTIMACGNNTTTNNNKPDQSTDMSKIDMTEDMEVDMCRPDTICPDNTCGMVDDGCGGTIDCGSPLAECPADSCGMVDDTCGGTIDCGMCACIDGQPQMPSCDACGVFALGCQGSQGICSGETIDTLKDLTADDCSKSLLYVDADAQPGGDGTKANPYSTLKGAMEALNPDTKAILLKGNATYKGTITLTDGVSILGGYGADWAVDSMMVPTIEGTSVADDNVFGVKAIDIKKETLLSNLIIKTPDAVNGHDNYGLYARDAGRLVLYKVNVFAGKGGDGTDGVNGRNGGSGVNGGSGAAGVGKYRFTLGVVTWPYDPLLLSNEGVNTVCPDATGGRGGLGGYADNQTGQLALKGDDSVLGVVGGEPGVFDMTMANLRGKAGKNAEPYNTRAMDGSNGLLRSLVKDGFFFREEADGKDGQAGAAGRGGGGASQSESLANNEYILAGPQGGGGAGGCGGSAGKGGTSGGNSFGVFVVTSTGVKTVSCTFNTDSGGIGGNGGSGGLGGVGGSGGQPTSRNFSMPNGMAVNETTPSSGRGGNGGPGQNAGHGGGGVGGASFGAYCYQTELKDTNSRFNAGFFAAGGNSPSGQTASDGPSVKQFGCE